jgi:peptidoglycan hydrolase-like protein with peptidoglycan-binding domain
MNKKILIFAVSSIMLLGIFLAPNNTSAQSINSCKNFYRSMFIGTRGDDVSELQQFLRDKGYFNFGITGFFGNLTYGSVVRWQRSEGINAIGIVGPATRNRISQLCGNTNYNDDSVPVYNFQPSATCSSWNDGCNTFSRTSPNSPAACTLMYCFAAGKGYCKTHFDTPVNNNLPPVISQFSGPTTLSTNQTGTWTIVANSPLNQQLTYNILWGDEYLYYQNLNNAMVSNSFSQTSSFTHSYSTTGTYTVTITVHDVVGNIAKSTSTVQVGNNTICTMEYAPVCGQPPEPACRYSNPACMIATPGPKTYSNRCVMSSANATYLYNGACTNGN